jgi:hypothetical protein
MASWFWGSEYLDNAIEVEGATWAEVVVTDDKTGLSDTFGLPTMSIVSFIGTSQISIVDVDGDRPLRGLQPQMLAVWGLLLKGGNFD